MTDPQPEGIRSFSLDLHIQAPREVVWQAIASDAGLRNWFAPEASIDPREGGEVVWDWGEHHRWVQRIEILAPGERLRTRYDSQVDDGVGGKRPLFIDFLLEGEGGSTQLRLVQSGFGPEADFDEEYDGISRGWPVELQSLKLYAERHAGQTRRVCWSTHSQDLPVAELWARLCGPEGLGEALNVQGAGQDFALDFGAGVVLRGQTLNTQPQELCGRVASHGDGFVRISVERWGGQSHVWLWLGSYDLPEAERQAVQERFEVLLRGLFGANEEARA